MKGWIKAFVDRPRRFGWPWHGFFRYVVDAGGDYLSLEPNNAGPDRRFELWATPYPEGQPVVVRNPTLPTDTRTAAEIAADAAAYYDWQAYALMYRGELYNAYLGQGSWVYCDPAGVPWVVSVGATQFATSYTVIVTLVRRFGLFGAVAPTLNTTLASVSVPFSTFDSVSWGTFFPSGGGPLTLPSPAEDGSSAYVNVHSAPGFNYRPLVGVLEVTLSGSGTENTGAGITAAVTVHRQGTDLEATETTGYTQAAIYLGEDLDAHPQYIENPPGRDTCAGSSTAWRQWTGTLEYPLLYAKTPSGDRVFSYWEDYTDRVDFERTWTATPIPDSDVCTETDIVSTGTTKEYHEREIRCGAATAALPVHNPTRSYAVSGTTWRLPVLDFTGAPNVVAMRDTAGSDKAFCGAYGHAHLATDPSFVPVYHPVLGVWGDARGFWL